MCGLIGLVTAFDPDARVDLAPLSEALRALEGWSVVADDAASSLLELSRNLERISRALVGWGGFRTLRGELVDQASVSAVAGTLRGAAEQIDVRLASSGVSTSRESEALAQAATAARDVAWRLANDALPNLEAAEALNAGDPDPGDKGWFELWRLNLIFNQLERLEVRGRDSGGLGTVVRLPRESFLAARIELEEHGLACELDRRREIEDLRDWAIQSCVRAVPAADEEGGGGGEEVVLGFAHKVAREVGELGDNVRALREKVKKDALLRRLMGRRDARVEVVAHTRWASNGIINEPNCHPVANDLAGRDELPRLVMGVLNGDVDNYPTLADGWAIPPLCTTDAKIIPLEIERHLESLARVEGAKVPGDGAVVPGDGPDFSTAFRRAVASFTGSTAIAAIGSDAPEAVHVSLRGSGQAVYLGVIEGGGYLFASELYGVVELASHYYKLQGEHGEVMRLVPGAGVDGISVWRFDGEPVSLTPERLRPVPIATRDIDRAGHPHFFVKEISEAPSSVERTIRGKFVLEGAARARFLMGDEVVPPAVRAALVGQGSDAAGRIERVFVIGQGTAAVAGHAVADLMGTVLRPRGIEVRGMPATDLSGFFLDHLGPETLVVAVSQSGTTTDTNRTVDLARERGARVIAIVNRRGSDLADKADGVLYTSDGRDVEMSVASTKAFYCQVVAGYLLALYMAELAGTISDEDLAQKLLRIQDLPRCLRTVLDESRERIRQAALLALRRSHWTVVGSGPLLPAAREIRIKLSELCYKSVSVDTIEDKKHIDLSSEPMILVCAAGLGGSAAADAVKEVAIFKAHNAIPIVICDRGETRFAEYAAATIEVPATTPEVALLLNSIAGHLFSYETARAIDACGAPLRRAREVTEAALESLAALEEEPSPEVAAGTLRRLEVALTPVAREVAASVAQGSWNAAMGPDAAHRLMGTLARSLALSAGNAGPLGWPEPLKVVSGLDGGEAPPAPRAVLERLLAELVFSVDVLRRPIDAIKHQAKTVTVGISREAAVRPPAGLLVGALEACGVGPEAIADQDAAALASLEPALQAGLGAVHYRLERLSPLGAPTEASVIVVVKKSGVAEGIASRADVGAPLKGTKRAVVHTPRVWLGHGQRDQRALVLCPLYKDGLVDGLGLIHVTFRPDLDTRGRARALKAVGRYEDLRCAITETDQTWSDELLQDVPLEELLTASVERLAERLRGAAAPPAEVRTVASAAPAPLGRIGGERA